MQLWEQLLLENQRSDFGSVSSGISYIAEGEGAGTFLHQAHLFYVTFVGNSQ
jgi:hypothetical protein